MWQAQPVHMSMQVARQGGVEGHVDADDHSLCSELSHVACASQASGVVNVHNVDTAMDPIIRMYIQPVHRGLAPYNMYTAPR